MKNECIVCGLKSSYRFEEIRTTSKTQPKTLMACIIKCVPSMANVLRADDLICPLCKVQLLAAVKFYEKCTEALTKLEARKNSNVINLNGSLNNPDVSKASNSQSVERFFNEFGKEIGDFEKELDGATKELETISNTLKEKYRLKRKLPPETVTLDLTTDTPLSNFEESKPFYKSTPILEVLLTKGQDNANKNSSIVKKRLVSTDDLDGPIIKRPKISALSVQTAWQKEPSVQLPLDKSITKFRRISSKSKWYNGRLFSFLPPFKQWGPQENYPVFLSCSVVQNDLYKLSLDLNKARVKQVFISPMRSTGQRRIIFLGSQNVSSSMIKPTRELGFTCINCGNVYEDEFEYKMHYWGKYKKRCPECDTLKPKTMRMLKSHYQNVHARECYTCPKCKLSFKTQSLFESHIYRYKDVPTCYFECKQCREKFKVKNAYEAHLMDHKNPKLCEICAKEFKTVIALKKHKRYVHADKTICPICGKMYSNVTKHMHLKHNSKPRTFMCDQCPQILSSNKSLKFHKLAKHGAGTDVPKPYCALCDKSFSYGYSLKTHTDLCHNKKPKFKCGICNEQLCRKDYLKHHMQMHVKYGPDWRQQRGRIRKDNFGPTKGKKQQKKYISSAPVLCNICNKVVYSCMYKSHYYMHLNYRPFKCKHCPMKFFNKPSATKHEKLHDDPTYNLSCRICYNKFDNADLLNEHLRKHASKLRYPCNKCDKKFGRMYLLEIHKVNEHAEDEEGKKIILEQMLKDVVRVIPEQEIDEYTY